MTPVEISGKLCAHMWDRTVPKDCISTSFSYQELCLGEISGDRSENCTLATKIWLQHTFSGVVLCSLREISYNLAGNLCLCLKPAFQLPSVVQKSVPVLGANHYIQPSTSTWENEQVGIHPFFWSHQTVWGLASMFWVQFLLHLYLFASPKCFAFLFHRLTSC